MDINTKTAISVIGYGCGLAAGDTGCAQGPDELEIKHILYPQDFKSNKNNNKYKIIGDICTRLAEITRDYTRQHKKFVVIGGDHSCAIGTWSGVHAGINGDNDNNNLGLIWIDAHLDSHTPDTTPSGNIHGMPVAVLVGQGDEKLTHILHKFPKIKPDNICFIGVRSFEKAEQDLIQQLNITVFYMSDIINQGLDSIFKQALKIANHNTVGYGLSIDLDGIDPTQAPGVGTPETSGLDALELITVLKNNIQNKNNNNLLGLEIAEFNPLHDKNNKTRDIIEKLIEAVYDNEH